MSDEFRGDALPNDEGFTQVTQRGGDAMRKLRLDRDYSVVRPFD